MIEIDIEKYKISVKGHASYDEHGKDIVCAAVSALFQTLIASVEELTPDTIEGEIQPDNSRIELLTMSDVSKCLFSSFVIGVEMIAENYPDNVRVCKH